MRGAGGVRTSGESRAGFSRGCEGARARGGAGAVVPREGEAGASEVVVCAVWGACCTRGNSSPEKPGQRGGEA